MSGSQQAINRVAQPWIVDRKCLEAMKTTQKNAWNLFLNVQNRPEIKSITDEMATEGFLAQFFFKLENDRWYRFNKLVQR